MSEATLDSQCDHILAWLKRGRAITPLDALQQFGCRPHHARAALGQARGAVCVD